ncbi:MAG: ABC transporter ATP-binding protein [Deltaproteobacteria bacterium]|jgi:iron complex transport system ATP-binding protein|nr:ABC transporter ATP-binding protein [Deltaproteobacteria bacterium]
MTEYILQAEKLTVGYGKPILSELNFKIPSGVFVSLLGPNGVGKTTLLRTLSRHLKPKAGLIRLKGRPLDSFRASDLAKVLSVVLTDRAAPPLLSVLEFAALGRHPHLSLMGKMGEADLKAVEEALNSVKATHLAGSFVDQLSDGERQKAVLARALAQEPELMILDEPTAHLDLKHRVEVMGLLRSLCASRRLTVLAAIHDVDLAAKVSDLVLMVRDGRLIAEGRPEDVLSSEAVAGLYDFDLADFSKHLGGVEVRSDGRAGRAFVVSGSDRTAMALRLLNKRGYALSASVPNHGDLDAHVARALRGVLYPTGDSKSSEAAFKEAKEALADCSILIDGQGSHGSAQEIELVEEAKKRGLAVLSLEGEDLTGLIAFLDRLEAMRSERL